VQDVNDAYKEQNDWFQQFLDEKCDVDSSCKAGSGELYNVYRMYCSTTNDYVRSTTDFYAALERNGFQRQMSKNKRYFKGLKIKPDTEDFPSLSSINVG
jgi:phage/plasmid-associated DNA primase